MTLSLIWQLQGLWQLHDNHNMTFSLIWQLQGFLQLHDNHNMTLSLIWQLQGLRQLLPLVACDEQRGEESMAGVTLLVSLPGQDYHHHYYYCCWYHCQMPGQDHHHYHCCCHYYHNWYHCQIRIGQDYFRLLSILTCSISSGLFTVPYFQDYLLFHILRTIYF